MTLTVPVLGFLELSLGDAAAAHERLAPLAQMIVAIGAPDPGIIRFLPDEIEALILLGRLADAEAMLVTLEERARRLDRISARAAAARCRALLHAATGDLPAADAALAEALDQHERLDQRFELGRTLLAKGSIDRRSRRRSEARAALTRAADLFRTLGAVLWEDKANAELSRISGRAPGAFGLTETEARVARLVAEGLSNREVAAALYVTDRTVEGHLSRIYAKLQVRSRTGLVRYLERGEPSEQR
jgi:DNA-binding NarL/FixJ family response regulator